MRPARRVSKALSFAKAPAAATLVSGSGERRTDLGKQAREVNCEIGVDGNRGLDPRRAQRGQALELQNQLG